jgi:hypothetical protein
MSVGASIPDDVRRFLVDFVDSAEQLEVLLLLHRSRERGWAATEVASELRTASESVVRRLDSLVSGGLVEGPDATDRYQFARGHRDEALVGRLAEEYKLKRVAVLELIFSRPGPGVRDFAEAFRLGPKGKR